MIGNLKAIRKAKGMTQAQLSKAAKIHRITISKYETGRVDPTLGSTEKLAAALGVTVDELIGKKTR